MKEIPREYLLPCEEAGRLEKLEIEGYPDAQVYVPAGYDAETGREYPVFFLLHGGGGDPYSFFSEDGAFKNMIDHMISAGETEPLLIVTPTYYPPGKNNEGIAYAADAVRDFGPIMQKRILPLVEEKYRTVRDRYGRGVGGFSMGAVATWFILMAGTDQFHWFMPMSGDCWICRERGGGVHPKQTAALMETVLRGQKFHVHALTGKKDIAFPNLDPQIRAMKEEYPDVFGKQLKYSVLPEGEHDYTYIRRYIYNALPGFFR